MSGARDVFAGFGTGFIWSGSGLALAGAFGFHRGAVQNALLVSAAILCGVGYIVAATALLWPRRPAPLAPFRGYTKPPGRPA